VPYHIFDREIVGLDMLRRAGEALFVERDPTDVFYRGEGRRVVEMDDGYMLHVPLPLEQGKIRLHRAMPDELIVHIGNRKRILSLPHSLATMKIRGARHEDGQLSVRFYDVLFDFSMNSFILMRKITLGGKVICSRNGLSKLPGP